MQLPEFFADTSDVSEIEKLVKLNLISGITTNPVIVAKDSNGSDPYLGYKRLVARFPEYPVSIQLLDEPAEKLLEHAKEFSKISSNIVIKIPMFGDGRAVEILPALIRDGVNINVTGLMSTEQVLAILKAGNGKGPVYVSLFFNRIRDGGSNPIEEITKTRALINKFESRTRIITGSIRKPDDVFDAVIAGTHIVTITPLVFWAMINHPKSVEFINQSQTAWEELLKLQKDVNGEIHVRKKTHQVPRKHLATR